MAHVAFTLLKLGAGRHDLVQRTQVEPRPQDCWWDWRRRFRFCR